MDLRLCRIAPVAFALAAACTFASGRNAEELSETEVRVVDLSKAGSPGKTYLAETIINAPMQKLCATILNYAGYPNFMPNIESMNVVERNSERTLVDVVLKLPMGKTKKYRLRMEPKTDAKSCHLGWKLVPRPDLAQEETIADTSGYWLMEPIATDASKTGIKYYVYSDPGPVPLGLGWIVDALGKDSLPKTLDALRNKVRYSNSH